VVTLFLYRTKHFKIKLQNKIKILFYITIFNIIFFNDCIVWYIFGLAKFPAKKIQGGGQKLVARGGDKNFNSPLPGKYLMSALGFAN